MIEIVRGTYEERIIKILRKIYPITVDQIKNRLNLSKKTVLRILQKFQVNGIVKLEPLPDKIYVRLLRHDFSFVGKKHQKKFIKHYKNKKQRSDEYDGIMYT